VKSLQTAQFCPKFDGRALNFSPTAAQKVVWTDRDGDSGAGLTLTLHCHSLDSCGGHRMVQQQHLTLPVESLQNSISFALNLLIIFDDLPVEDAQILIAKVNGIRLSMQMMSCVERSECLREMSFSLLYLMFVPLCCMDLNVPYVPNLEAKVPLSAIQSFLFTCAKPLGLFQWL
jgi:hypothetical protein